MAGSNKRPWRCVEGEGEGEDGEPPRELKRWRPLILEVMGAEFLLSRLMVLEPNLRRVVREELEKILANSDLPNPRLPVNENSRARYQLRFQNDLPERLYTNYKVKSKDGKDVEIAIFDTVLKCTVISAPWSSAKVEVVVLDGDFCAADEQEKWSKETFKRHIVNARQGRPPLLLGDVVIKLNQGVGYLPNIKFTDNSSWTRSRMFRLALRLRKSEDAEVEEGISRCFVVNEGRLKAYKKHHPPSPTDKVYYLEGIHKDGEIHKRLLDAGISTVQQLLRAHSRDPEGLRNVSKLIRSLDGNKKGVAPATWEATIDNARECHPGDERYCYHVVEVGTTLLFNSFYRLLGVHFGEHFCTIDNLNAHQKASLENWKKMAFLDPDYIVPCDPMMIGSNPTHSFGRQQENPIGGWNSTQVFSNRTQCFKGNEVPCDEFRDHDHAESCSHFSQLYNTSCQEARTSMLLTDPATDQMNHLREEEIAEFISEYRRPELIRQWAKAITKLKFIIHIDKSLAISRCKMRHFNMEIFK